MDISIVIPAYNEKKCIGNTLEKIESYFKRKNLNFEIIVVDDGSKDNTEKVVRKFMKIYPEIRLIKHSKNKGKGGAVKTGVLASKGDLILFSDADLSTPIEEFEKLKKAIDQGYDIAIGSRGVKGAKVEVKQNLIRRLIGIAGSYLIRSIVTNKFKDTQCGFKMFKKDCGKKLFENLKINGFAFDIEILYKAIKKNYNVKEVPVVWRNSPESKVNIIKDPLKVLIDLLRIRTGI